MSADPGNDGRPVDDDASSSVPPPSEDEQAPAFRWKTNAVLFCATVLSVFLTGAQPSPWKGSFLKTLVALPETVRAIPTGWTFAVPLLAILLTHEFGHYFAARVHRVDASLPYFIPLPLISPFGTMGAVIAMRGRIRSRDALLDIGASGPLAGLCVAIPVLIVGLMGSKVAPRATTTPRRGSASSTWPSSASSSARSPTDPTSSWSRWRSPAGWGSSSPCST